MRFVSFLRRRSPRVERQNSTLELVVNADFDDDSRMTSLFVFTSGPTTGGNIRWRVQFPDDRPPNPLVTVRSSARVSPMRRRHLVLALLFVSAGAMGCEDPPGFLHAPTATVASHTLACQPRSAMPKNTTLCLALVRWSDGGPIEGVSQYAAWESSNPAVATTPPCRDQGGTPVYRDRDHTLSGCGVVTYLSSGTTEIRATFQGVIAIAGLSVVFIPD